MRAQFRQAMARGKFVGRMLRVAGLMAASWGTAGFVGLPTASAQSLPPEVVAYADIIAYNGQVITVDNSFSIAEAVAVRDGKFLAVGTTERIRAMAGPKTRQIDLQGRSLVPGFIDTHNHYQDYAEQGRIPRVLYKTKDQWVADIKKLVDAAQPGEWIVLRSERPNNQPWADSSFGMTRHELDPISPNNPIFVWTSPAGNDALINSYALRLANMPKDISGLVKDAKGEPTGYVDHEAYGRVYYEVLPWPNLEKLVPLYKTAMKKFNMQGKTTVGARFPPYVSSLFKMMWDNGELTLRMRVFHEFARVVYNKEAMVKRVGNLNGLGDNWFKISAANVGNPDGAVGGGRAWTRKPKLPAMAHANTGEGHPDYGFEHYFEDHEASDWKAIPILSRYGWRILGVHTAGDRSVDELISAFEEANRQKSIVGMRHGIDHSLMIRSEHIEAIKRLGLVAGAEENTADGTEELSKMYGADEVYKISPMKTMINAGIPMAMEGLGNMGKDATGKERTPLWFIAQKMLRKDIETGKVWNESERVSREEGLKMTTIWGAYYLGDEKTIGSIEPGKLADFVILDGDYMKVPEDKLADLKAVMTVIDGKVVYEGAAN
jgi:predicted amidohydrolase YtcJ